MGRPFVRWLDYSSNLITAEMSTRAIPTVRRSLKRMQDFLLHCASISTEIGEYFRTVIAFPPMIKDKEPFLLVEDGAFAFLLTLGFPLFPLSLFHFLLRNTMEKMIELSSIRIREPFFQGHS